MSVVIDGLGHALEQGIGKHCPEDSFELSIRFQYPKHGLAALAWKDLVIVAGIFDPECLGIERRVLCQRLDAPGNLTCPAFGRVSRHPYNLKLHPAINHYRGRIHYFKGTGWIVVVDSGLGFGANDRWQHQGDNE
jgi:hypothetical protein